MRPLILRDQATAAKAPISAVGPGTSAVVADTDPVIANGVPTSNGVKVLTTLSRAISPPLVVNGSEKTNDRRLLLESSQSIAVIPEPGVLEIKASFGPKTMLLIATLLESIIGLAASSSSMVKPPRTGTLSSVCVPGLTLQVNALA
jgi:hypothetical protein